MANRGRASEPLGASPGGIKDIDMTIGASRERAPGGGVVNLGHSRDTMLSANTLPSGKPGSSESWE